MSNERLVAAIDRIERALARVEAVAQRPAAAADQEPAFSALQTRHLALKSETQVAIAELDRLISAARGGS